MIRRTPLRRISKKRAKEGRIYATLRKSFLEEHPFCQFQLAQIGRLPEEVAIVTQWKSLGEPRYFAAVTTIHWGKIQTVNLMRSEDVHHVHKRGPNYLKVETWKAVSRSAHDWIHNNPGQARRLGWLV